MIHRLALLLLPIAALAEGERVCTLKLAWWDAPAATPPPVLALGSESEHRGFSPEVMNFGTEARNLGEVANLLVRETTKDPRTGKDVHTWSPFASVPLPSGDDTLGVVLISDPAGKRGSGRAFSLGTGRFPLGSIRLVNLTGRELLLGLDGRGVTVGPGAAATHPKVFGKPEVAEITVVAALPEGQQPVFSTKSQFSSLYRLAIFIVEIPGSNPPRFETRTVMDYPQPEPKPATPGAAKPGASTPATPAKPVDGGR